MSPHESGSFHSVLLDTNILVAAAYNPGSASGQVVADCLGGRLNVVFSPDVRREYDYIVPRALHGPAIARNPLGPLLALAREVHPTETPRVVPDDAEDDKLIAAAVTAEVDAIVTNDAHLLWLDPYRIDGERQLRIVRPGDLLGPLRDSTSPADGGHGTG